MKAPKVHHLNRPVQSGALASIVSPNSERQGMRPQRVSQPITVTSNGTATGELVTGHDLSFTALHLEKHLEEIVEGVKRLNKVTGVQVPQVMSFDTFPATNAIRRFMTAADSEALDDKTLQSTFILSMVIRWDVPFVEIDNDAWYEMCVEVFGIMKDTAWDYMTKCDQEKN